LGFSSSSDYSSSSSLAYSCSDSFSGVAAFFFLAWASLDEAIFLASFFISFTLGCYFSSSSLAALSLAFLAAATFFVGFSSSDSYSLSCCFLVGAFLATYFFFGSSYSCISLSLAAEERSSLSTAFAGCLVLLAVCLAEERVGADAFFYWEVFDVDDSWDWRLDCFFLVSAGFLAGLLISFLAMGWAGIAFLLVTTFPIWVCFFGK